MSRKYSWWKGVSAIPVCLALTIPADFGVAQEVPAPKSSRRAGPAEAPSAAKPAEIKLGEIQPQEGAEDQVESSLAVPVTAPDASTTGATASELELVQERYPNGAIKIEREMKQDAEGNYILHGIWTMYDTAGNIAARGRYENGERHGTWTRVFRGDESEIFSQTPYKEYAGPYLSQITFENGRPHGKWIIGDSREHKISEITFADGERHGVATWWYASGSKMQEIVYREGLIDGDFQQWSADAKLHSSEAFQGGRRLAPKVTYFPSGQKRLEETYLSPPLSIETRDDWWNARFLVFAETGKPSKHGESIAWHENGQKRSHGQYMNNLPEGKFTWWYPSGQKSMEGSYQSGKPNGLWTWWHPNGQKATRGEYQNGAPVGKWFWWKEDGKVVKCDTQSPAEQLVDEASQPAAEAAALPEEPTATKSILKR